MHLISIEVGVILLSLMPTSAQWEAMPIWEEWLVNRQIVDFANDRQFINTAENLPLDTGLFGI